MPESEEEKVVESESESNSSTNERYQDTSYDTVKIQSVF